MAKPTKLKVWMDSKGYTNRTLADQMELSYEWIYKYSTGRVPDLSRAFKWRFIECFGREEAAKVFEANPQPTVATEVAA